jgi:Bacterial Ig-like domain (group 3)
MLSILGKAKQWFGQRAKKNRSHSAQCSGYRPTVEVLECRCVPANITWGGGVGNWSVGANWVGGNAPVAGDTATIPRGILTIDQANITVAQISMQGGGVTIPANRTLNVTGSVGMGLTNIAIGAGGDFTINGTLNVGGNFQAVNDVQTTEIAATGTLSARGNVIMNNSALSLLGGTMSFTSFNITGNLSLIKAVGSMTGNVNNGGNFYVGTPADPTGRLGVCGDFISSGTLSFTVSGANNSRLNIFGDLGAGGTLAVSVGAANPNQNTYTLINYAGNRAGNFGNPSFGLGGRTYNTAFPANQVNLVLAPPRVNMLNPRLGPANGGTWVAITGDSMVDVTQVLFGSVPATSFTIVSDTEVDAVSPAESPGTVDVTVTAAAGTSDITPADQFTFVASSTILTSSANPSSYGQDVTFTAAITTTDPAVSPTGSVDFTVNGNDLGNVPVTNGIATITVSNLAVGDQLIAANYSGDQSTSGSSATLTQTVTTHTSFTLSGADFGFTDPNPSNLIGVTIMTPPVFGTLTDNGVIVTAGSFISGNDINSGLLIYTSAATSGAYSDSVAFQVQIAGNSSPSAGTLTITVTPVNSSLTVTVVTDLLDGSTSTIV